MIPKVLLVDDVTMFLELQKVFLKLSSVHVLTACNGIEAIEMARRERPALIFMDLHLPGMNGDECCAAIKLAPPCGRPTASVTFPSSIAVGRESRTMLAWPTSFP